MEKEVLEVLKKCDFGKRTAEEEADSIEEYFVETDQWDQVKSGVIDIIYGAKGSGKSAIYSLILKNRDTLFDKKIILVSGEQPQGSPVFKAVMDNPPSSDTEFANLWKLYALSLYGATIREYGINNPQAAKVVEVLEEVELLPKEYSLGKLLKYAIDYVKSWTNSVDGFEGSIAVEPTTMAPMFSGKILFREPSSAQAKLGAVSIEELITTANTGLAKAGYKIWLLLDRLDVAFSENDEVEATALRGLFKFYLDTKQHDHLRCKIFLRSDIWRRVTEKGFREASHIERSITIAWRDEDLLKLATRRFVSNKVLVDFLKSSKEDVLGSYDAQSKFFYRICPDQVETGPNKPNTFNWILGRTTDATGNTAPREIVHFLNKLRDEQISRIEGGRAKIQERMFEQVTFKDALPEVSKVRLEQTLYAEYPQHRAFIEKLTEQKATQTLESLSKIWSVSESVAASELAQLEEIGFVERKQEGVWRVPFLYWPALKLIQGMAD